RKRHPTVPLDESLAQVTDATSSPDPQELAMERIRRQALRQAIDRLAPDQREVLLLRLGSGLTGPEIAEATGRSVGAVKALQHRALVALSRMLAPNEPDATRTLRPGGGALHSGSD
ncbi:MAG: sigma-70 family RNA polymerase sigma factor, partial [Actinomycetota bacterium]